MLRKCINNYCKSFRTAHEMETQVKYEARIHINANKNSVKFIGTVKANSLKVLKEEARKLARNWNNHLSGRLHLQIEDSGRELFINANA